MAPPVSQHILHVVGCRLSCRSEGHPGRPVVQPSAAALPATARLRRAVTILLCIQTLGFADNFRCYYIRLVSHVGVISFCAVITLLLAASCRHTTMVNCAMFGCSNHSKKKPGEETAASVGFFASPRVVNTQCKRTEEVTARRRAEWLRRINRKDMNPSATHYKVCGKHFVTGKYIVIHLDLQH